VEGEKKEGKGRRGKRRKQLLDVLKEREKILEVQKEKL
jgi:hypothetical protein